MVYTWDGMHTCTQPTDHSILNVSIGVIFDNLKYMVVGKNTYRHKYKYQLNVEFEWTDNSWVMVVRHKYKY